MASRRWVQGQFRRNNYQHKISAKIGTMPLTVIYVDMKTAVARSAYRLKPGDRIKWRYECNAYSDVMTGIVAPEYQPGGTLFISLL